MNKGRMYVVLIVIMLQAIILTASTTKENNLDNVIEGELIVLFDENSTEEEIKISLEHVQKEVDIEVVKSIGNYVRLALSDPLDVPRAKEALHEIKKVDIVENNYEISSFDIKGDDHDHEISSFDITDDDYIQTQWPIYNSGKYKYITSYGTLERNSTENVDIDAFEAWALYDKLVDKEREVIVAVIDTGIDYQHPELKDAMWKNPYEIPADGKDNDGNGYIDDIYGWDFYNNDSSVCHYAYNDKNKRYEASSNDMDDHGTHIAGIIAAKANNGIGIAGVASNANVKLMSLKINGGKSTTGSVADAIEAIKYATANGAKVCNISWGVSKYHEAFERVMAESGMLFVCAAGNSGTNNDKNPVYPASFELDNVISVTYINAYGNMPSKANYGKKTVDIAAPGEDIYSTIVGSYKNLSGTSMAAPHVTAVAAMLYSTDSYLYPSNVKDVIASNTKAMTALEGKVIKPGIVSASKVLLSSDDLKRDTIDPIISLSTEYYKDRIKVSVDASDKGGSGIRVIKYLIGKKGKAKFQNGTAGTSVSDNEVFLSKSGYYTFYVADYAGNSTTYIYEVKDDVYAPAVDLSYSVANNYRSILISVNTYDYQSGVKQIKYMKGKHEVKDFLPESAGTKVRHTGGIGSFAVTEEGIYTIYVTDYRGNKTVRSLDVKIVKSTNLRVFPSNIKSLSVGERYSIKAVLYPLNSTDKISYISSNPKKASVSTKGVIYAKEQGSVTITVKSSSGKSVVLYLEVE